MDTEEKISYIDRLLNKKKSFIAWNPDWFDDDRMNDLIEQVEGLEESERR